MTKSYIPTINISALIKNNFETQSAFKTIKTIPLELLSFVIYLRGFSVAID